MLARSGPAQPPNPADTLELTMTDAAMAPPARSYKVIGLISLAHSFSHFFQLAMPPLFPFLKEEFGVGYAELGLLTTLFYVASGLSQTPSGFLVDRFGARPVLFAGLGLLAGAILLCGLAPSYWTLMPLMILAGLGNSVFHPSDYSILTASVERGRLGRAYGAHTLGGNLGWAAAPVVMLSLATLLGWRGALLVAGAGGLLVLALLATQAAALHGGTAKARRAAAHAEQRAPVAIVLMSAPILLCFGYFTLLAIAGIGLQNFLPATLGALYGTPLAVAGAGLTFMLLGSSAGIVVGSIAADRAMHHDRIVAAGLAAGAILILVVAQVDLSQPVLMGVLALAGFAMGITTPSRDMLVRGATPYGATGRVFGFVYSGLDAGSAVAPVVLGVMLDHGHPGQTLWFAALALLLAVGTATSLKRASRPAAQAAQ
jgi:FSR family fosmidomycin resistance protein-like MFS transporter